jgi:hypothetical protein
MEKMRTANFGSFLVLLYGHCADALIGQSFCASATFLAAVFGARGGHQSFASSPNGQHTLKKADPMAADFNFLT